MDEKKEKRDFNIVRAAEVSEEYDPLLRREQLNFANLKLAGNKVLKNSVINVNIYEKIKADIKREDILKAVLEKDLPKLREYSDFFYNASGIYARLCHYMAFLYKYDWYVTPLVIDQKLSTDKVIEGFWQTLLFLDDFHAKEVFSDIALSVVKNGVYYGYQIETENSVVLQELPTSYCRSRFSSAGRPAVEFNMKYFDDHYKDSAQKLKILQAFPSEFYQGWKAYKEGKLREEFSSGGMNSGWYLLDIEKTVRFRFNKSEIPLFISVLPALLDLEEAKDLDKQKMKQRLLKIIIQKMPMDKNGELIFDVDEAAQLHSNAVNMLGNAIGVDVLTTFADVDVADLSDRSTVTTTDEISKIERSVFNEAGVSQGQFNAEKTLALEKSILNDEAQVDSSLIPQFEAFLNHLLKPFNKVPKKLRYRVEILPTTIYNYRELSKLYKEQMSIGFSKLLPQVALGQSQSSILSTVYFENEVLMLNEIFDPPVSSSSKKANEGGGEPGRPPKEEGEVTEKTIQNREAM